jgi:hypothetical protein
VAATSIAFGFVNPVDDTLASSRNFVCHTDIGNKLGGIQ